MECFASKLFFISLSIFCLPFFIPGRVQGLRPSPGVFDGLLGGVWIEHPPAGLPRALVLDTDEPVVEGQVVADGVLKRRSRSVNLMELGMIIVALARKLDLETRLKSWPLSKPDKPFFNFRASKSVDRRILCSSKTDLKASKF